MADRIGALGGSAAYRLGAGRRHDGAGERSGRVTDRAPQAYAEVERWLERRYARRGLGYIWDVYCIAIAITMVMYSLAAVGLTVNFDGSRSDLLSQLVIVNVVILLVLPSGFLIWIRGRGKPGVAWVRGERSRDAAPAAWRSVLRAPLTLTVTNLALSVPFQVGLSPVVASGLDAGTAGVPVILGGVAIVAAAVAGLTMFGAQFFIRPILREIAAYLPPDAPFVGSRFGVARQLNIRLAVTRRC